MIPKRIHTKHKVYNISYHITWIPKYRKPILVGKIKEYLKECLLFKANIIGISIEASEIMPNHIHLFIKSTPNITISFIVKQLKGYSSYMLRKKFILLRRYKSLWTHSYYAETIGLISETTIKKYIKIQTY